MDPSRRLSGDLSAAGDWRRDLEPPTIDRQTRASRALLSDLLDIAATVQARRPVSPHAFTLLAERALAIDSSDDLWQDVARRLNAARALSESGRDSSAELARAIGPVVTRTSGVSMMRTQPGTRRRSPLVSAWAEERRP